MSDTIRCGYCGITVLAITAHQYASPNGAYTLLRCPNCSGGTVRTPAGALYPPAPAAGPVKNMPSDVDTAWREARTTFAVAAYTASEMMCRKILMHLAVDVAQAQEGVKFYEYVNALAAAGYVLPGWKPTVDSIRDRGNTANHELPASSEAEALQTLGITEFILKAIYEVVPPQP